MHKLIFKNQKVRYFVSLLVKHPRKELAKKLDIWYAIMSYNELDRGMVDLSITLQDTSWKDDPFLSIDKLALLSLFNLLLKFSLRNSTVMNVRAEAGIYHVILGMLPLNIPLAPSASHILRTASNQPLYLREISTVNWEIDRARN